MRKANKFGRGGCFKCCECGRQTRDAGDNGACEMCPECYERCSLENEVSDSGETPEKLAEIESWRAKAVAKGGVLPAPATVKVEEVPAAASNRKLAEDYLAVCESNLAESLARLHSMVDSINCESLKARQLLADGRGSIGSTAANISAMAMEMASIAAEVEQHKAVRQSVVGMLKLLAG